MNTNQRKQKMKNKMTLEQKIDRGLLIAFIIALTLFFAATFNLMNYYTKANKYTESERAADDAYIESLKAYRDSLKKILEELEHQTKETENE